MWNERLPLENRWRCRAAAQVLLNLGGQRHQVHSTGGVALIVEPEQARAKSASWCATPVSALRRSAAADFPRVRTGRRATRAQLPRTGLGLSISERIVKKRMAGASRWKAARRRLDFEVSIPLAASDSAGRHNAFSAPDLTGQSIMLVAPQTI